MKRLITILLLFSALSSVFAQENALKVLVKADFSFSGTPCIDSWILFQNKSTDYTQLHWYYGDGTDSWSFEAPKHKYFKDGTYNVSLVAIGADITQKDSIVKTLVIGKNPTIFFEYEPDTFAYEGNTVTIKALGTFNKNAWYKINTTDTLGRKASLVVSTKGFYCIKATDDKGCSTTDTTKYISIVTLNVKEDSLAVMTINNILTPNGDGMNDALLIKDYDYYVNNSKKIEIYIYNVWGDLVYHNASYANDWKGVSDGGKPLDAGTYYYLLNSKGRKGKTGYIDIIR